MRGSEILRLIMDLILAVDIFLMLSAAIMLFLAFNPRKNTLIVKKKYAFSLSFLSIALFWILML